MTISDKQKNLIDNALLLLSFQEKLNDTEATEEDRADYASFLTFKEAASASFMLSNLLLRLHSSETGKSQEEIIQLLRNQLLQMSLRN